MSNTLSTSSSNFGSVKESNIVSHSKQLATKSSQRPPRLRAPASLTRTTNSRHRPKSLASREQQLQAQIIALQADYAARLPALLEEIGTCWHCLAEHNWGSEKMLELRWHMHKLAGSAASFGFAKVGRLASQIEDHLLAWENLSRPPTEREQNAVALLLRAMRVTASEDERISINSCTA